MERFPVEKAVVGSRDCVEDEGERPPRQGRGDRQAVAAPIRPHPIPPGQIDGRPHNEQVQRKVAAPLLFLAEKTNGIIELVYNLEGKAGIRWVSELGRREFLVVNLMLVLVLCSAFRPKEAVYIAS